MGLMCNALLLHDQSSKKNNECAGFDCDTADSAGFVFGEMVEKLIKRRQSPYIYSLMKGPPLCLECLLYKRRAYRKEQL